ncbi:MAG: lysophospholipid acyltransferase family protein [Acidobacteria bacterium]|nr:lysophospholipid acyltransferase family protein [Candidatus Sulfomarinibacter kjeldsenii]
MTSRAGSFVLYASLRSFLGIGGRLPLTLSRPIGQALGRTAAALLPRSRKRIRSHLEIAFPDLDQSQRDAIERGCARHFGLMLAEVAWLWHARPHDLENLCVLEGAENFFGALEGGRGVIFTTGHCGTWELLSARLPIAGVPLTTAARRLDDPRLDRLVTSMRSRFGTEIILRGPAAGKQMVRALAGNRVAALLIDQDIRGIPGVFVPFFGQPTWTPSGGAMLAIRRGCPVVPGFIHRRADGSHKAEIHPPLPIPVGGSLEDRVQELTAAATAVIERQIRTHPEQWVWMHRRWRTRPESVISDQ